MSVLPIIDPEFRGIVPPLSPDEREQLEQNIVSDRKCHDPIVLWEGLIIDGHSRFEICVKHSIEFQIEEMQLESRDAAKAWIIENQLCRRNLTDAARIELALLKAEMLREKAKRNQSLAGGDKNCEGALLSVASKPALETVHVQKTIAAEAGVGEEKLYNYMQIKEHGSPKLLEHVQRGEMKIGTAYRLLSKEIFKQLSLASKMIRFINDAMPPEGYETAHPKIHSKLIHLSTLLHDLLAKCDKEGSHEAA